MVIAARRASAEEEESDSPMPFSEHRPDNEHEPLAQAPTRDIRPRAECRRYRNRHVRKSRLVGGPKGLTRRIVGCDFQPNAPRRMRLPTSEPWAPALGVVTEHLGPW